MKLEKAIEILQHYHVEPALPRRGFVEDAIRLGILAMRHIQKEHSLSDGKYPHLLPGETQEGAHASKTLYSQR